MNPFRYVQETSLDAAVRAVSSAPGAMFFAGGTTMVDLMKIDVLRPDTLVDVSRLPLAAIEVDEAGVRVGANVSNRELAWHQAIRERYPVISEALLAGASQQLRNMATTAGNIMQRTRCPYFRDVHAVCNKRHPGSGCAALEGYNRNHAVLGVSEHCIATHASDLCVALAILDAVVRTQQPDGSIRRIPFKDFHLLPGNTPDRETMLAHGELITHVDLPNLPLARRSHYLKVRDRTSYEFALASAAVALDVDGGVIRAARVALGGVAAKPWRSAEAEQALLGRHPAPDLFRSAADAAFVGATPRRYNAFKIELAKRTLVQALTDVAARAV